MDKSHNKRCIVTTDKRFMLIYEIMYIVGLTIVLIGMILNYIYNDIQYFYICLIIATALFVLATFIWALDRKCEPVKELLGND